MDGSSVFYQPSDVRRGRIFVFPGGARHRILSSDGTTCMFSDDTGHHDRGRCDWIARHAVRMIEEPAATLAEKAVPAPVALAARPAAPRSAEPAMAFALAAE